MRLKKCLSVICIAALVFSGIQPAHLLWEARNQKGYVVKMSFHIM